jgi:hypothetical protein
MGQWNTPNNHKLLKTKDDGNITFNTMTFNRMTMYSKFIINIFQINGHLTKLCEFIVQYYAKNNGAITFNIMTFNQRPVT